MIRRYQNGVIVGAPVPPTDFGEWLRGEVQRAETLDDAAMNPAVVAAVHARRACLREARYAWERRATIDAAEAVFLAGLPTGENGDLAPGHTVWANLGPQAKARYQRMAQAAREA